MSPKMLKAINVSISFDVIDERNGQITHIDVPVFGEADIDLEVWNDVRVKYDDIRPWKSRVEDHGIGELCLTARKPGFSR